MTSPGPCLDLAALHAGAERLGVDWATLAIIRLGFLRGDDGRWHLNGQCDVDAHSTVRVLSLAEAAALTPVCAECLHPDALAYTAGEDAGFFDIYGALSEIADAVAIDEIAAHTALTPGQLADLAQRLALLYPSTEYERAYADVYQRGMAQLARYRSHRRDGRVLVVQGDVGALHAGDPLLPAVAPWVDPASRVTAFVTDDATAAMVANGRAARGAVQVTDVGGVDDVGEAWVALLVELIAGAGRGPLRDPFAARGALDALNG